MLSACSTACIRYMLVPVCASGCEVLRPLLLIVYATELQQSCNRAATELQQRCEVMRPLLLIVYVILLVCASGYASIADTKYAVRSMRYCGTKCTSFYEVCGTKCTSFYSYALADTKYCGIVDTKYADTCSSI